MTSKTNKLIYSRSYMLIFITTNLLIYCRKKKYSTSALQNVKHKNIWSQTLPWHHFAEEVQLLSFLFPSQLRSLLQFYHWEPFQLFHKKRPRVDLQGNEKMLSREKLCVFICCWSSGSHTISSWFKYRERQSEWVSAPVGGVALLTETWPNSIKHHLCLTHTPEQ